MRRKCIYLLLAAVILTGIWGAKNDFGLGRNMEILIQMMRQIATHYVDEVDPDRLMADAAEGMVRRLDPYTEYLPEEEMSEFDRMATGKYGGVGSLIRKKGEWVIFAQPYKDSPADRAGIRIGDKILAIDGESCNGWSIDKVSSHLKGDPNTTVRVKVQHLIGGTEEELTLKRERIAIPAVPYAGWVAEGIGYIQHNEFTHGCSADMRSAVERLLSEGELKGLVLDYRSNGGGVLQEAVKTASLFLPRGTEVVRTKGRGEEARFETEQEPLLPDLRLVVLIGGNTASSAEIVAGAIQDLDRGVLMGQKSFGKGLVQSTLPLSYNAYLKLTTGKYYIPSGRCIQAIDYSEHAGAEGREVADSLTRAFKTAGGRTVYDGGGITPDLKLEPNYISRFAMTLYALGFIEDFVDDYVCRHASDKEPFQIEGFSITDTDYADFKAFMADKEVPYESASRKMLKAMKRAADEDNFTELEQEIALMEENLKDDTEDLMETYRQEIMETINSDIVLRYAYAEGVTRHSLERDKEVKQAVELLQDSVKYTRLLQPQEEE